MASKTNCASNDYSRLLYFLKTSKKNKDGSLKRKPLLSHPVISNKTSEESHQNFPLMDDEEIGDVDLSDIELGMVWILGLCCLFYP